MEESNIGIFVLLVIGVTSSVLAHYFIKRTLAAVIASACVGSLLFNLFTYYKLGFTDPLMIVALINAFAVVCVLSYLIGKLPLFAAPTEL